MFPSVESKTSHWIIIKFRATNWMSHIEHDKSIIRLCVLSAKFLLSLAHGLQYYDIPKSTSQLKCHTKHIIMCRLLSKKLSKNSAVAKQLLYLSSQLQEDWADVYWYINLPTMCYY